jgi:hypothetical protein
LSNLDDEGYWIEDEAFEYKGQPVLRKAKTWAHGALKSWVELRRSNPVAREMLQHIELMQQPAGFQDSIISKLRIEQTAGEGQRFMSRDLNASYLSEGARKASFLSQEICHFEAGKITAVIQPTDTDVAFSYKALTNAESNRLKRELRDKAIEQNTQAVYRCGPYEVLRVVYQAHIKLQQQDVESQALLACFRRNGFLAYRPDFEKGCLVPFEDDKLPMGSHRYPKAWLEHRLSWRDEHGVPVEACWDKKCGAGIEAIEDMVDHTQHGDPKCQVKMACQPHAPIKEVHLSLSGHVDISEELPDAVPHSVGSVSSHQSL